MKNFLLWVLGVTLLASFAATVAIYVCFVLGASRDVTVCVGWIIGAMTAAEFCRRRADASVGE